MLLSIVKRTQRSYCIAPAALAVTVYRRNKSATNLAKPAKLPLFEQEHMLAGIQYNLRPVFELAPTSRHRASATRRDRSVGIASPPHRGTGSRH